MKEALEPMGLSTLTKIQNAQSTERGFTLVEVAVVISLVAILSTFVVFSFGGLGEDADAEMVQAVQAALQATVTQATERCHQNIVPNAFNANCNINTSPQQLVQADVINALSFDKGPVQAMQVLANGGGAYQLIINQTNRGANYQVSPNGDVRLTSLTNFTDYTVRNGTIAK